MSELQVVSGKALPRSLTLAVATKGNTRRNSSTANFPRDITELLATFLENLKEVRDVKDKLPNSAAIVDHNARISDVVQCAVALQKSSTTTYSSAEQKLYESHVSLAVVSDVGRMVFQTKLTVSSEHLSSFIAYSTARPPPLALARKLKSVYEKMQRLRVSIEQTGILFEEVEKHRLAPTRPDCYTSGDINALLTDIDNQFELVQRMVVYLRGEIETLEPATRNADKEETGDDAGKDLQFALKGMTIADRGDNHAHSFEFYPEDSQCSTPRVTKTNTAAFDLDSGSSPIKGTASKGRGAAAKRGSAWDHLRSSIKQAKRPNYSFELYEQMTDNASSPPSSSSSSLPASQESPSRHRDGSFRQFSSAYRHLRGSHNASAVHVNLVEEAAAAAITQYNSPPPKSSTCAQALHTPQTCGGERGAVPFVTSPTFALAANSPGDWRHIRAYTKHSASANTSTNTTNATKAAETVRSGFSLDYNSPLVGLLDHIGKYAERQPKLPPPITITNTANPTTANSTTSAASAAGVLGERRERGSNVSDSPSSTPSRLSASASTGQKRDSRSASKDFTKPTFAASSGVFGSGGGGAGTGAGGGGVDKLGLGSRSADREEAASPTIRKKSGSQGGGSGSFGGVASSPGSASSGTSAATHSGAASAPPLPTTVPEINQMLRGIYMQYVPEKLGDVPKLLVKYAGREKELLDKAIKKFGRLGGTGPDTDGASSAASIVGGTPGPTGAAGVGGAKGASPSGVRPREGSAGSAPADEQPRSRSASVSTTAAVVGTTAAGAPATAPASSLFGGGKPVSTGFGPATIGGAAGTTTPATATTGAANTLFGGGTGGSLFTKPAATASAAGAGLGAAGGMGSLFATPATTLPTSTPTLNTASSTEDLVLQRVTAIYSQHNPSKLAEIPTLMEKYRGKELQLVANLEKKYNVPHEPLVATTAPSTTAPTSVFGGGGTSLFGGSGGGAQPSTGFGPAAGANSLFTKPAAATNPSPFGNANTATAAAPTAGGTSGASPFGTVAAASGIPSPFGTAAVSPFANNTGNTGNAGAGIGGIGGGGGGVSLFGSANKTAPSTGFGQTSTIGGNMGGNTSGTGGLFGGYAGVSGTSSPFTNTNNNTNNTGTGGLFGGGASAGSGSPFGNNNANNTNNTNTGGLFGSPNPTSSSPFGSNSGFSTPLGKVSGSVFNNNTNAAAGGSMGGVSGMSGMSGMGVGASPGAGGLLNRAAATPGSSLFGGGGGGTSTGFGNTAGGGMSGIGGGMSSMGGGSSLFGGGNNQTNNTSTALNAAPLNSLSTLQQIHQRVTAIYSQHNPSKLAEIPTLMEKYRGKELQLVANLEKKYNIAGGGGGSSSGGGMMGGNNSGSTSMGGFGSFGGNNNTSTGFGPQSSTGGLFGGSSGGMGGSTGFGGIAQSNAGTPGASLFGGRPAGASAATGSSLFGGGGGGMSGGIASVGMGGGMNSGMGGTQTGFGGQAAAGSGFGRPTVLGGGTSTGFGGGGMGGGGGTGGLFGGGNSGGGMWGSR